MPSEWEQHILQCIRKFETSFRAGLASYIQCDLWHKYQIVISYLQHLIRARDMTFDDDEIWWVTFCRTNLPVVAGCICQHPVLTDDGTTANVQFRILHWHLKLKYSLSLNRNVLNYWMYIVSSSDQRLQIYRVF